MICCHYSERYFYDNPNDLIIISLYATDPRRPDFGITVPILRAVFRVPPGYIMGHTSVPLLKIFGLH